MNNSVREYLQQFEQASKAVIDTEKKIFAHNCQIKHKIEEIEKLGQEKIAPVLANLDQKKQERESINQRLKAVLSVNAQDLLKALNEVAHLHWLDRARMTVSIDTQEGFLSMDDLKAKIQENDKSLRNAFRLSIYNDKHGLELKFCIYKTLPLNEDIKFSDGSSIYDNLVLVPQLDNFNMKVTKIQLSEEGKQKLMITFSPEDLINKTFKFMPVELLRNSVLNVLEKNKIPTM